MWLLTLHAFPLAVGAVAVVFLGLFFLLPLIKVFGASILDPSGQGFTLANYASVLSNRFFLNGLTNSLGIAAAASICAVLVGVPFAFCLARLPIGGKPALLALAALPLVLPSFVGAYALVLLFGRSGIINHMLEWAFTHLPGRPALPGLPDLLFSPSSRRPAGRRACRGSGPSCAGFP